jgi:hypothetical protein
MMSLNIPVEKKFAILVEINRASHFAWREAVLKCCPDVDPQQVVNEMWHITGVETAEAYLKRLDPSRNLAEQLAECIVWSSQCMGEQAHAETGERPGEHYVQHDQCPWHRWHDKKGLLAEDRPGCDRWFEAMIKTVNDRLGSRLRFKTVSALPESGDCCLRVIWEQGTAAPEGID